MDKMVEDLEYLKSFLESALFDPTSPLSEEGYRLLMTNQPYYQRERAILDYLRSNLYK